MPFFSRYAIPDAYTLEELRRTYQSADAKGRIHLLKKLYRGHRRAEGRAPFEIALLAVEDPHVEVRQWIARYGRSLDYSEERASDKNLEQLLKNDPDPFVRACLRENPTLRGMIGVEAWREYFREATHMERLALVRNPYVWLGLIEKIFDPEDKELNITLEEREELVYAFLTNTKLLTTVARAAFSRDRGFDWIAIDTMGDSRNCLRQLWHLASKWPRETKIQSVVYY